MSGQANELSWFRRSPANTADKVQNWLIYYTVYGTNDQHTPLPETTTTQRCKNVWI